MSVIYTPLIYTNNIIHSFCIYIICVYNKNIMSEEDIDRPSSIYCGNNYLDPRVVSKEVVIGNRYSCLRKGVGVGMHLPDDESYLEYRPIDTRKIYCGLKEPTPEEYDYTGSLSQCFQKGVGVGKKKRITENRGDSRRSNSNGSNDSFYSAKTSFSFHMSGSENNREKYTKLLYKILIPFVLLSAVIFVVLYLAKPKIILNRSVDTKTIDWNRFMTIYILSLVVLLSIIMMIVIIKN